MNLAVGVPPGGARPHPLTAQDVSASDRQLTFVAVGEPFRGGIDPPTHSTWPLDVANPDGLTLATWPWKWSLRASSSIFSTMTRAATASRGPTRPFGTWRTSNEPARGAASTWATTIRAADGARRPKNDAARSAWTAFRPNRESSDAV